GIRPRTGHESGTRNRRRATRPGTIAAARSRGAAVPFTRPVVVGNRGGQRRRETVRGPGGAGAGRAVWRCRRHGGARRHGHRRRPVSYPNAARAASTLGTYACVSANGGMPWYLCIAPPPEL